ncbi:adenosylmethionine--8-amino-7-oxononanoate aminotransferase BioA, partial [Streptomyces sp. SID8455]|nr:adenosylmethionine--8-amino-7-oxononanoate aminotransferase BioA [Streptomyces sp. SID8455]
MPEPYVPGAGPDPGPAAPKPYSPDELRALDRAHVWHPYGPMPGRQEPLVVESASGVRLRLAE